MNELELKHWGIKGMKWGVRRFQNKDGSLTAKGRKRYKDKEELEQETIEQKKARVLKSRSARELYKNADLFDDSELQKAYNRLNLERNIASLSASEVSKGSKFVDKIVKTGNKISDLATTGTKLYNHVARITNTFVEDADMPIIKEQKKKDKD